MNYEPERIIYNGKATIVFWEDGTKTVVKCAEGTEPDKYNGFCAALAKKIFGNNSRLKKSIVEAENRKKIKSFGPIEVGDYVLVLDGGKIRPSTIILWFPEAMDYYIGRILKVTQVIDEKQVKLENGFYYDLKWVRKVKRKKS